MDKNVVTKIGIKAFSVALFVVLLTTAHAAATTVSLADVVVEPNDVVTLPIVIDDIIDYGSGTINITYNPSVVHVTDVTSSPDSTVLAFNNTNVVGFTTISALNTDGANGDMVFANVEFTAVGSSGDSTPLNLDVVTLYDRSYNALHATVIVTNGSITVPQPPKSFLIYGYVAYENGTPCNNPTVNITNLNNGERWTAETNGNGGHYQILLTSGVDLNVSEILRFDVTDGVDSSVTDHTVTADEVDGGGLFDFNLILGPISGDVNDDGRLTTADATIVLQMAVSGEYLEVADVSGDGIATSLDALMILQAVDQEQ